jgi:hypothetical protein
MYSRDRIAQEHDSNLQPNAADEQEDTFNNNQSTHEHQPHGVNDGTGDNSDPAAGSSRHEAADAIGKLASGNEGSVAGIDTSQHGMPGPTQSPTPPSASMPPLLPVAGYGPIAPASNSKVGLGIYVEFHTYIHTYIHT